MTNISTMRKPTTLRRSKAENMRKLIEHMVNNEMTADDMGSLLEFSPSGVRKYVADLFFFKIIEIDRYVHGSLRSEGRPMYRLVNDDAHVMEFLEQLESRLSVVQSGHADRPTALDFAKRTGRNFHLMQDDAYFGVRVQPISVQADPRALPREFFQPTADEGLPRRHVAKTKPPPTVRWPEPTDYKLEIAA